MSDRMTVQRDDLGRVVRLVIEDAGRITVVEMDPERAEDFFRDGLRKSLDLQSGQASLDEIDDEQETIDEATTKPERSIIEEALEAQEDRPDIDIGGDAIFNPNDPTEW